MVISGGGGGGGGGGGDILIVQKFYRELKFIKRNNLLNLKKKSIPCQVSFMTMMTTGKFYPDSITALVA